MRIAFVIPYFYPALQYGGTPRVAYEFARGLVRRGHEVTVVTTDSGGETRIDRNATSLEGIRISYYPNVSNYLAYRQRLFFPVQLFRNIDRDLASSDVIHIHEFRSLLSVAAHSAAKRLNIPYVLSPHGGLQRLGKARQKSLFDRLWGNQILNDAAVICAVSNLEKQDAKQFGIAEDRISLLPNPIDEDTFKKLPGKRNPNGKRVLLFLGRLHWIKGVDVLMDALKLLADIPNLHLVIAGPDDGVEEALRAQASTNKIADKITFAGFLGDAEKLQALADCEIVVIPSRREGFPGTALEALAAAKPLVVSSMCGTVDSIAARSAVTVFENGNAHDLALKLRGILESGPDPQDLLTARNAVLSEFSIDAIARKAEEIYESVLVKIL
jgi:glycosyltransferase involved in cell wall biosynthesis